jgi:hypothetical protein
MFFHFDLLDGIGAAFGILLIKASFYSFDNLDAGKQVPLFSYFVSDDIGVPLYLSPIKNGSKSVFITIFSLIAYIFLSKSSSDMDGLLNFSVLI